MAQTAKAGDVVANAKKLSDAGLVASATTMLTLEMIKVVNTLEGAWYYCQAAPGPCDLP